MNKKSFKSNHMVTFCWEFTNMFLCMVPGLTLMIFIIDRNVIVEMPLGMLYFGLGLILFMTLFGNIIHFITCIFKKPVVFLDDKRLTYHKITKAGFRKKIVEEIDVTYDRIRGILFDEGFVTKYGGGDPATITLLDYRGYAILSIPNPSFFMTLTLIKRCNHAPFKIAKKKRHLLTLIGTAIFGVFMGLFGDKC